MFLASGEVNENRSSQSSVSGYCNASRLDELMRRFSAEEKKITLMIFDSQ